MAPWLQAALDVAQRTSSSVWVRDLLGWVQRRGETRRACIALCVAILVLGGCGHILGLWPHVPQPVLAVLLCCKALLLPLRWLGWGIGFAAWCHAVFVAGLTGRRVHVTFTSSLGYFAGALAVEVVVWGVWWWSGSLPSLLASLRHTWMGLQYINAAVITALVCTAVGMVACAALRSGWNTRPVQCAIAALTSFPRKLPGQGEDLSNIIFNPQFTHLRGWLLIACVVALLSNAGAAKLQLLGLTGSTSVPHLFIAPVVVTHAVLRVLCFGVKQALLLGAAWGVLLKLQLATGLGRSRLCSCTGLDFRVSYMLPVCGMFLYGVLYALSWCVSYEGAFSVQPGAYLRLGVEEGTPQDPVFGSIRWVLNLVVHCVCWVLWWAVGM